MRAARGLVVTSIFPNGEEPTKGVYISQIVQALSRHAQLRVVAPVPYCPPLVTSPRHARFRRIPSCETRGGLAVGHPRYPVIPKFGRALYGFFYFGALLGTWLRMRRSFRPDFVLAFWAYPDAFAAMLLSKLLRVPFFTGCRGCDVNTARQSFAGGIWVRLALRHSARVFAVSRAMAGVICDLGVAEGRISVVPNGIDPAQFGAASSRRADRHIAGLECDAGKTILFCGRLSEEKGVLSLIEALPHVKSRYPGVRLVLAGSGALRNAVLARARELGVGQGITVLDELPHEEIPGLMRASDVLCLPSIREGWPNVVAEALACGTPVVASQVGGVPEILTSPALGIMVPPGDVGRLAEALVAALGRDWDREQIQALGGGRTWEDVAREMWAQISGELGSAGNTVARACHKEPAAAPPPVGK